MTGAPTGRQGSNQYVTRYGAGAYDVDPGQRARVAAAVVDPVEEIGRAFTPLPKDWQDAGLRTWEDVDRWVSANFNAVEAGEWIEDGFDVDGATTWRQARFTSGHDADGNRASDWDSEGFDVATAVAWADADFLPSTAAAWADARFEPDDVEQWRTAGFAEREGQDGRWCPSVAAEWRDHGFDPETARAWNGTGHGAVDSAQFIAEGLSPGDVPVGPHPAYTPGRD